MSGKAIDLADGLAAVKALFVAMRAQPLDLNEADTRHRFIDQLVHECLGWDRSETNLERRFGDTYSDYELGTPPRVLIEAKKAGMTFEVPAQRGSSLIRSIQSICRLSTDFKSAFEQAQKYCSERGIPLGVICNSTQIAVFLAVRNDGIPPSHGRCLFFDGWEEIERHFPRLWQAMSRAAEDQGILLAELASSEPSGLPQKLSSQLPGYPSFRYPSDSQQSLRTLSDLLIEDAPNTPSLQKRFYEECGLAPVLPDRRY